MWVWTNISLSTVNDTSLIGSPAIKDPFRGSFYTIIKACNYGLVPSVPESHLSFLLFARCGDMSLLITLIWGLWLSFSSLTWTNNQPMTYTYICTVHIHTPTCIQYMHSHMYVLYIIEILQWIYLYAVHALHLHHVWYVVISNFICVTHSPILLPRNPACGLLHATSLMLSSL
jgi:hypothetical protein